jgi:hypothetical protein
MVLGAAVLLIVVQLAFRAWALYPSWFYLDDLLLLDDASGALTPGYLLSPHDSQLMPLGRAIAWLVASSGSVNWTLAATITVVLQAAASAACCWMLVVLFGPRPGILVPLGVYLTSAMTMSSSMWWAAGLNALPLQIAFFCSVAAWFRYQTSRRGVWLVVTLGAVLLGLSAYVKALVLLPLLAYLAVAYFADGTLRHRLATVVRRDRVAVATGALTGVAFLTYYLLNVPGLSSLPAPDVAADLAQGMLGEALVSGLAGGPWRWDEQNPPVGLADPPVWALQLATVAVVAAAAYWTLRRRRTGRAWLLLGGYALLSFLVVLVSRAGTVGAVAGLEYRYLSDVTCAWALVLGLLSMSVVGSDQGSAPREEPLLTVGLSRRAAAGVAVAVVVSGAVSSFRYVDAWHGSNDADDYFANAAGALAGAGPVDLADDVVPDRVLPGYQYPRNRLAVLMPLVIDNARFPSVTGDLVVLDDAGVPHHAVLDVVARTPPGPDGTCGWRVTDDGRLLTLEPPAPSGEWWLRIGYLSPRDDEVDVTAAGSTTAAAVREGARSLFLRVDGAVTTVRIDGVDPGSSLCVDTVEVGRPTPGEPL